MNSRFHAALFRLFMTFAALTLVILLSDCKIEVEDVDVCVTFDFVQMENLMCIEAETEAERLHCFCPSDDSAVQTICDTFNLPERRPETACKE